MRSQSDSFEISATGEVEKNMAWRLKTKFDLLLELLRLTQFTQEN